MPAVVIVSCVILGFIIIASCILNAALFKYTLRKSPLKFKDRVTISLCISDFLRAFVGYSIELSMFAFESEKNVICVSFGFIIPFFSYAAIFQMSLLLIHRWIRIKKCTWRNDLNTPSTKGNCGIVFCWVFALILSGMPLFKIGAYGLESSKQRCSVIWKSVAASGVIYVIALFLFAFIIPLISMVTSFVGIQLQLRKRRFIALTRLEADPASAVIQMKLEAEKRNAFMFLVMTFMFLLAWAPYAGISFVATFASQQAIPEIASSIAVLPVKASSLQNPLIVVLYDSGFRSFLKQSLWCGTRTNDESDGQQSTPLQQLTGSE